MNQTQRRYICKRVDEITEAKMIKLRNSSRPEKVDPTKAEIKKALKNKLPLEAVRFSFNTYQNGPEWVSCSVNMTLIDDDIRLALSNLAISKYKQGDKDASSKINKIREESSRIKDEVMLGDDAEKFMAVLAEFEKKEF